ncbi:MAG: WD40 repeat domain-containing protein [Myxococcota bacterium]
MSTNRRWQTAPFPAALGGPVRAVAFSQDNTWLATGGDDGVVRVWHARTGMLDRAFALDSGPGGVTHLAWAEDTLFATAAGQTWSLAHDGHGQPELVPGLGEVLDAAGLWFVTEDPDTPRGLRWWRVPKRQFTKCTLGGPDHRQGTAWRVASDAPGAVELRGDVVVVVDFVYADEIAVVMIPIPDVEDDWENEHYYRRPRHPGTRALAVARDGTLAFAMRSYVWLRPRGGDWRMVALPARDAVFRLAFSPDCRLLAVAGPEGVDLVDVATATPVRALDRVAEGMDAVFAPRGPLVHVAYAGLGVASWSLREGKRVALHRMPNAVEAGRILRVADTPEGLVAVTADRTDDVSIWDVATDTRRMRLPTFERVAEVALAWPWVSVKVAAAELEEGAPLLRVWDARSGALVLGARVGRVGGTPALHPSGLVALSQWAENLQEQVPGFARGGGGTRVFTVPGGAASAARSFPSDAHMRALTFSPDGRRLVLDRGRALHVLDLDTGRAIPVSIPSHGAGACAWSPDGMRLAATRIHARGVSAWHDGAYVADELVGHRAPARALAFSPDGRRLVTTGADGQVLVWSAATGRLVTVFPAFLKQNGRSG